jgi:hypothetical protein
MEQQKRDKLKAFLSDCKEFFAVIFLPNATLSSMSPDFELPGISYSGRSKLVEHVNQDLRVIPRLGGGRRRNAAKSMLLRLKQLRCSVTSARRHVVTPRSSPFLKLSPL